MALFDIGISSRRRRCNRQAPAKLHGGQSWTASAVYDLAVHLPPRNFSSRAYL